MVASDAMLFVHLIGVVTLFGAMVMTLVGVVALPRSTTRDQFGVWLRLTGIAGPMFPAAFVLILVGGLYMANDQWSFADGWIVMALVSVAWMGALGTGVQGRMLTSMARSLAAAADGPGETAVPADLASRARSPVLRVTTTALLGMATGVLWLMTNKPGWAGSA